MITTASAILFNREPSEVLGRAERGETVVIERSGEPCAIIIPHPRKTSGAEIARRLRRLTPMPEAADAVEKTIKDMDATSRRSYGLD
jgi:antitoxin (DNA-binding transcriptional repressor) of toxin-antitoxin stability system